jgi:hypothetical protein
MDMIICNFNENPLGTNVYPGWKHIYDIFVMYSWCNQENKFCDVNFFGLGQPNKNPNNGQTKPSI